MKKRQLIDKGSNQYLKWTEELYEDDESITYIEWGYSNKINLGPGIDDDIEFIVKIKKEDLGTMTFDKLIFFLKNLGPQSKHIRFCSFLERKKIKFDKQIW